MSDAHTPFTTFVQYVDCSRFSRPKKGNLHIGSTVGDFEAADADSSPTAPKGVSQPDLTNSSFFYSGNLLPPPDPDKEMQTGEWSSPTRGMPNSTGRVAFEASEEFSETGPHTVRRWSVDVGTYSNSLTLSLESEPKDGDLFFAVDPQERASPFEYGYELSDCGVARLRRRLSFGGWVGKAHIAVWGSGFTDSIKLTAVVGQRVRKKDDLHQPWGMLQRYNWSTEVAEDIRRWFFENDHCAPLVDEEECTPLIRACKCPDRGSPKLVKMLLTEYKRHFNVNKVDDFGKSALEYLSWYPERPESRVDQKPFYERNLELMRILLENGADPNIKDKQGNTPLHSAAATDLEETGGRMVQLLLDFNAEARIKNAAGETPFQVAKQFAKGGNARVLNAKTGEEVERVAMVGRKKGAPRRVAGGDMALCPEKMGPRYRWNLTEQPICDDQIRELFDSLDKNKDGWVSRGELHRWKENHLVSFEGLGSSVEGEGRLLPPTGTSGSDPYSHLGDGKLTYEEFAILLLHMHQR